MFEYDRDARCATEVLDEYNLSDILSKCNDLGWRDPWDIKERVLLTKYPELTDTLDDLSLDEFIEYLCARYPVRFEEVVSYRIWYVPDKQ